MKHQILSCVAVLSLILGCAPKQTSETPGASNSATESVQAINDAPVPAEASSESEQPSAANTDSEVAKPVPPQEPAADADIEHSPESEALTQNSESEILLAKPDSSETNANDTIYAAFLRPCDGEHCQRDELDEERFNALVESGVDVNIQDDNGKTPLMKTTSAEVVQALLKAGASVNAVDHEGKTALMYFAQNNCFSNQENLDHCTIERQESDNGAHWDNRNSCSAVCADLLIKAGAKVNAVDMNKRTPLMHVRSVDANASRDYGDDTASFVELLIKNGAKVNAKDKDGKTPLMYVGNAKAASLLIKAGAKINAKDNLGRTPLMHCLLNHTDSADFYDLLKVLKNAGANSNDSDKCGNTLYNYIYDRISYDTTLRDRLHIVFGILDIWPTKKAGTRLIKCKNF